MCILVMLISSHKGRPWASASFTASSRGSLMLLSQLFSSHSSNMVGIQLWELSRVIQSPCLPYMVGRGLLFQVWFPPDDMFECVMGIQPGVSGVVIEYQVDEFTHTWSAEQFVAHSHICFGSQVRCHHYPLSTWTKDWGLFISRPSSCRLWAGLGVHPHWFHWDTVVWTHSLMSLMSLLLQSLQGFYTCLVLFLILLNHSLLLASDLTNYSARLGHFISLCLWPPRCQHQNWFIIFWPLSRFWVLIFNTTRSHHIESFLLEGWSEYFWLLRLALVQLLLPLSIQDSSFLAPELHLLIPFLEE